jgi:uncharacterized protein
MPDQEPLILVGASVRAAAQSAIRAGFQPWCIDQFGDLDLTDIAGSVRTVTDWPAGIETAFREAPDADWLYTGALENDPELVGRLSESQRLLGCGPDALKWLRDPGWLAQALTRASLPCLPVIVPATNFATATLDGQLDARVQASEQWIQKPLASAAGINVRDFDECIAARPDQDQYFLQKKVTGQSVSGVYLGVGGAVQLLGMCEQLCRGPGAADARYVYAGSLGPLSADDIPQRAFHQAQQIGSAIANWLAAEGPHITGLFGIDFMFNKESGDLWTLEVNPRYPASAEVYERAFGWSLIWLHVNVCRLSVLPSLRFLEQNFVRKDSKKHGKLILYSRQDFEATDITMLAKRLLGSDGDQFTIADIPHPGTLIRKNEPVCTILTAHESLSDCRERLISAGSALLTALESATK